MFLPTVPKAWGPRHKPSFRVANRTLEAPDLSHLWTVILWGHKTCINKMFSQCFNHSCFHMGKGPASDKYRNFHRENVPLLQSYNEESVHPQISTYIHVMKATHSLTASPLCVLFLPSQPETVSDCKNTPSTWLGNAFTLPLYSVTWSPQQEGNIDSLSGNKQVTDSVLRSRE